MARGPVKLDVTISQSGLKTRYENMLNNVANMLDSNGPIYSTWIYFQIGLNDSNSIVFDTSSQNKLQNLIASLHIEKSTSAVANNFTLTVQYDPFNFGQNSTDSIEKLDEFVAQAMSEDFDNPTTECRGKIQYGYNSTSATNDSDLVSPLYSFFLTNATSNVSFDSGIVTYTFEGVSSISMDCDYVVDFDKIEDKNLLEVVGRLLYRYYGDESRPPENIDVSDITPESVDGIKYGIDISSSDIDEAVKISLDKTSNTQSPWMYCKSLLDENPLTQKEVESKEFENIEEISLNKRPRYNMYVTDVDNKQTIHIVHVAPSSIIENGTEKVVEVGAQKIDYVFSWGMKNENLQNKNIVTGWRPEVDLYTYLIRKANHKRFEKMKELWLADPDKYKDTFEKLAVSFSSDVLEMYNAEIELIGIPADPPMSAEIEIIPRVLENVSRTAGIYSITAASDEITNTGVFKSTLKLFRVRSRNIDVSGLTANETAQKTKVEKQENGTYLVVTQIDENTRQYEWKDINGNNVNPDGSPINGNTGGRWLKWTRSVVVDHFNIKEIK